MKVITREEFIKTMETYLSEGIHSTLFSMDKVMEVLESGNIDALSHYVEGPGGLKYKFDILNINVSMLKKHEIENPKNLVYIINDDNLPMFLSKKEFDEQYGGGFESIPEVKTPIDDDTMQYIQ